MACSSMQHVIQPLMQSQSRRTVAALQGPRQPSRPPRQRAPGVDRTAVRAARRRRHRASRTGRRARRLRRGRTPTCAGRCGTKCATTSARSPSTAGASRRRGRPCRAPIRGGHSSRLSHWQFECRAQQEAQRVVPQGTVLGQSSELAASFTRKLPVMIIIGTVQSGLRQA